MSTFIELVEQPEQAKWGRLGPFCSLQKLAGSSGPNLECPKAAQRNI